MGITEKHLAIIVLHCLVLNLCLKRVPVTEIKRTTSITMYMTARLYFAGRFLYGVSSVKSRALHSLSRRHISPTVEDLALFCQF